MIWHHRVKASVGKIKENHEYVTCRRNMIEIVLERVKLSFN